jgi:hypothetical protein
MLTYACHTDNYLSAVLSTQGKGTILVADAGQLDKFKKKFGGLGDLAEIGAAASASGPPTGENIFF